MSYNFDEIIDRKGTRAVKIERCSTLFGTVDLLPLWVADMDFRTPDFILDAIKKRLEHPILGYTLPSPRLNELFIQWVYDHHGWEIKRNQTGFVRGIVPALSFAVQCFTQPGDEIILQSPVYYPFFNVIRNNGRVVLNNQLVEKEGRFEMDLDNFESLITDKTKMFILCSPHNPGGRVWPLETLQKISIICAARKILVISDEIHADMVLQGHKHIPFAMVSEEAAMNSLTLMAPSKVFNMPGVISSAWIIPNPEVRKIYHDYLEVSEMNSGNLFAYDATVACYEHGDPWRIQMLEYIQGNISYIVDFLKNNIPQIVPMVPEASFLVWLDCSGLNMQDTDELHRFFSHKAKLGLNKGTIFGPGGEHHVRINIATPRAILEQAMQQLFEAVNAL